MKHSRHLVATLIAVIFSWLFYQRSAGINLLIFDTLLFAAIFYFQKEKLQSNTVKLFLFGMLASSISVTIINSTYILVVHHFTILLLGGALAAPHLKAASSVLGAAFMNIGTSINEYFQSRIPKVKQQKPRYRVYYVLRISIIPLVLVGLFGILYSNASPWFNNIWSGINTFFGNVFEGIFTNISISWLLTLLFGFIITIYLMFAKSNDALNYLEGGQTDDLKPNDEKDQDKSELQIAVALFASLNAMLLMQNILDISHVWIGFEWNGEYLKQFVHEGTWLLIVSIFISAALVIYFFRFKLNYIQNNKVLKMLTFIFIAQNMLLTLSVAVRNLWYIEYFNLAYKRIGVFFFLLAVLYGLYTIVIKVNHKKSLFYLIHKNSIAVYVLVLVAGFANWDTIIAKYNFAHANTAYVHLKFLSGLSDKALPYLEHSEAELEKIKAWQNKKYKPDTRELTPVSFIEKIEYKKTLFLEKYPDRHWLEWNYADARAYKLLTN